MSQRRTLAQRAVGDIQIVIALDRGVQQKIIAHDHGMSVKNVSRIAVREGRGFKKGGRRRRSVAT